MSGTITLETIRKSTAFLFETLGINQIVVVDDQYAEQNDQLERLLGLCAELSPEQASALPLLAEVPFSASYEIWSAILSKFWDAINSAKRSNILTHAIDMLNSSDSDKGTISSVSSPDLSHDDTSSEELRKPSVKEEPVAEKQEELSDKDDEMATQGITDLFMSLDGYTLTTLSLSQWKSKKDSLLSNSDSVSRTLFLFDKDFRKEGKSDDYGIELIRQAHRKNVTICGLITHTIVKGQEIACWKKLADDYGLDKNRFLVVSKQRLTSEDTAEYYGFLRMVRYIALSNSSAAMKMTAWSIFEEALEEAKKSLEAMSILDFDQIVFTSSIREGVWEPDTLFRVFSVLLRREALTRLHDKSNSDFVRKVAVTREISTIPLEIGEEFGTEPPCPEALKIQRFELYESAEYINKHNLPLELGDMFIDSSDRTYLLLSQPCDLMVRSNGNRSYDDKHARSAKLVEVIVPPISQENTENFGEIKFFHEETGASAYANFAKSYDFRLAVLDLCVFNQDGSAQIDLDARCPGTVIQAWKKHNTKLYKLYNTAYKRYTELKAKSVKHALCMCMLPVACFTRKFRVVVEDKAIKYDITRVGRLKQPLSGAILIAFARYNSRAAFPHHLYRITSD